MLNLKKKKEFDVLSTMTAASRGLVHLLSLAVHHVNSSVENAQVIAHLVHIWCYWVVSSIGIF